MHRQRIVDSKEIFTLISLKASRNRIVNNFTQCLDYKEIKTKAEIWSRIEQRPRERLKLWLKAISTLLPHSYIDRKTCHR